MNDTVKLMEEYKDLQRMEKEIKQRLEALKSEIQSNMVRGGKVAMGGYKASWTVISVTSVDQKILKARFPEIAEKCITTREQERFTIT